MAHLIHCIHCDHEVSSDAGTCPGCGGFPRHFTPYQPPRPASYSTEDQYVCPVCATKWSPDTFQFTSGAAMGLGSECVDAKQRCSRCGHPFGAYKCEYCKKGVFEGKELSVLTDGGYVFYHHSCYLLAKPQTKGNKPWWQFW